MTHERRTVLSGSLESEFAKQSPNSDWRFRVCETTCAMHDCDCELIRIDWFGHGLAGEPSLTLSGDQSTIGEGDPLSRIWPAKEVRRRHVAPFVQGMLDELVQMTDHD